MKYITLVILCFTLTSCKAVSIDPSIIKQQVETMNNKLSAIENASVNTNAELSLLKTSIGTLSTQIGQVNTEISAKVTGLDNSVTSSLKQSAGRDAIGSINSPELFKLQKEANEYQVSVWRNLFRWMVGIVILLVNQLFKFFNKYMQYREEYIKKLDPETAEQELAHMRDKYKGKPLVEKVAQIKDVLLKKKG